MKTIVAVERSKPSIKRLFQLNKSVSTGVKRPAQGDDGSVMYFDSKPQAKAWRDILNDNLGSAGYTVGKGPDHVGYSPRGFPSKYRRKPKGNVEVANERTN